MQSGPRTGARSSKVNDKSFQVLTQPLTCGVLYISGGIRPVQPDCKSPKAILRIGLNLCWANILHKSAGQLMLKMLIMLNPCICGSWLSSSLPADALIEVSISQRQTSSLMAWNSFISFFTIGRKMKASHLGQSAPRLYNCYNLCPLTRPSHNPTHSTHNRLLWSWFRNIWIQSLCNNSS